MFQGFLGVLLEALRTLMGFDFAPFNCSVTLTPVRVPPWDPFLGESHPSKGGEGESTKRLGNVILLNLSVTKGLQTEKFVDLCLPDSTLHNYII